jgi:FkbM family methyltransferase
MYEKKFERYFQIDRGDTVLDVGACVGDTTVPVAIKTGEDGFVVAVEPEPRNVRYLRVNTAVFNNAKIVEKAAWKSKGTVKFNINKSITGHSVIDHSDEYVEVQVGTLDNIVKHCKRKVDFAKVDVQGAELQVFEGDPELLETTKKLVVETHYFGEKGTAKRVNEFLMAKGYETRTTPDRVVHAWK